MPERRNVSARVRRGGIGAELGVYDDVLLCLSPGEPWLEHGIVEHRYKELCPTAYKAMIHNTNTRILYWALPPGPAAHRIRTWAELATELSISPDDWHLPYA